MTTAYLGPGPDRMLAAPAVIPGAATAADPKAAIATDAAPTHPAIREFIDYLLTAEDESFARDCGERMEPARDRRAETVIRRRGVL